MVVHLPESNSHSVKVRKCRLVLEISIGISEITPEIIAPHFTTDEEDQALCREWAQRHQRLLNALLQNQEALHQFLTSVAQGDLGLLLESQSMPGMKSEAEDDFFARLLGDLADEDRKFFEEAVREGYMDHCIELINNAFVADWEATTVLDGEALRPGNGSNQET